MIWLSIIKRPHEKEEISTLIQSFGKLQRRPLAGPISKSAHQTLFLSWFFLVVFHGTLTKKPLSPRSDNSVSIINISVQNSICRPESCMIYLGTITVKRPETIGNTKNKSPYRASRAGFIYIVFNQEESVHKLLDACKRRDSKFYFTLSSKR